ncbi:MAG TPA: hypothetical protein VFX94_10185 [Burkholderiales bacterium]|nr:hypothetical protein [Burkholderiales bacterium]
MLRSCWQRRHSRSTADRLPERLERGGDDRHDGARAKAATRLEIGDQHIGVPWKDVRIGEKVQYVRVPLREVRSGTSRAPGA